MKMAYGRFVLVMAAGLLVMYLLTMSLVRSADHFKLLNPSNFYMALIMVAGMSILMILVMFRMFPDARRTTMMLAGVAVMFVVALWLGRNEAGVGNEGFLNSMIPHHSRAILTCQEAELTDPEIVALCDQIVTSQQEEIAQMERILDERY